MKIWDTATGAYLTLVGHLDPIYCVIFAPDSRLLASGSSDDTVRVWDITTGSLLHTLRSHSSSVHCVTFSPDGLFLVSGSSDRTIKLWDVVTSTLIHTFEGHWDTGLSLRFSLDDQLLATSSGHQTVKIWYARTAALHHTWRFNREVTELEFIDNDLSLRTDLGLLHLSSRDAEITHISHLANDGISVLDDT